MLWKNLNELFGQPNIFSRPSPLLLPFLKNPWISVFQVVDQLTILSLKLTKGTYKLKMRGLILPVENKGETSPCSFFLEQFLEKTCILSSFPLFEMYVTLFFFIEV